MHESTEQLQEPTYDDALQLLFAFPAMIKALIQGFAPKSWYEQLDLSTLETVNVRHVTESMRRKESDRIWKVRCKGSDLYLLILIEFQGRSEHFMATRSLVYGGLTHQSLVREKSPLLVGGGLPHFISFVLYTGSTPWNAPCNFGDCLGPVPPLKNIADYQNAGKYVLIDLVHMKINQYNAQKDNLVFQLLKLERSKTSCQATEAMDQLSYLLSGDENFLLREAFFKFIKWVFEVEKRFPGVSFKNWNEVKDMLGRNFDRWFENLKEKKIREAEEKVQRKFERKIRKAEETAKKVGEKRGKEIGQKEGEAQLLLKQLIVKFKSVPLNDRLKLKKADLKKLDHWGMRLLSATSLEEVFEKTTSKIT